MYLLLQSRTDQSGWHEYKCIYESIGLSYNEIMQINLASDFITQEKLRDLVNQAEAIIIGGQGEVGYGETNPKKRRWLDNIRKKVIPVLKETLIHNPRKKILGVCFGHQLLAEALGSIVAFSPAQKEVGIETVFLTEEGEKDPLFKGIDTVFPAILAHKDAVLMLPNNTTHLAYSEKCSIQAFRYGKAIYGVQFHPELDYKEFKWRVGSTKSEGYLYESLTSHEETTIYTHQIVQNFVAIQVSWQTEKKGDRPELVHV